jgi:type II pantothenate kinase
MTSGTYQADAAEPVPTASGDGHGSARTSANSGPALSQTGRPRTATTTAEIDTAITHPGSVRINVKGAFIVDQGTGTPGISTPGDGQSSPTSHEHNGYQTKDIRLPNHTAVVSHVAIDVCCRAPSPVTTQTANK